jgi:peptidoglycan/LPS O-acetylase OafA/YrhL
MGSGFRHTHRRIRAALSVASVVIVFAAVVAVAAFSPTWFGSLWFYFIVIAALGVIYAMYYLSGREKPPNP